MSGEVIQRPKCISLFTGGCGLDLGVERSGFEIVVGNDILEASKETLEKMRPERPFILDDLFKVNSNDLLSAANLSAEDISIVIGGSPCQSYSILGKRKSIAEENGLLLFEFLRVIRDIKPRMFVLENVPGLMSAKGPASRLNCHECNTLVEFDWFAIESKLRKDESVVAICPNCNNGIYNGIHETEGGVLKILEKEFHKLGYTTNTKMLNSVNYGVPQTRKRVFMLGYRGDSILEFPAKTHRSTVLRRDAPGDERNLLPPITVEEAFQGVEGLPNMEKRKHGTKVRKRYEKLGPGSRDKVDHTDRLRLGVPAGTLLVGSSRGGGRPFIHPTAPRIITVREGARLQAFPDDWIFYGTVTNQYRLIGNAVPVKLAEVIATSIYHQVYSKAVIQVGLKKFEDLAEQRV